MPIASRSRMNCRPIPKGRHQQDRSRSVTALGSHSGDVRPASASEFRRRRTSVRSRGASRAVTVPGSAEGVAVRTTGRLTAAMLEEEAVDRFRSPPL